MAEGVHGNQRANRPTGDTIEADVIAHLRDVAKVVAQGSRIDTERTRLTVDEVRDRATVADGIGGGDETEGGHEHFVVSPNADQLQRDVKRRRPVRDRDGTMGAGIRRQAFLEAIDEFTDRRHERGVEALLQVCPLVAGDERLVQHGRTRPDHATNPIHDLRRQLQRRHDDQRL